MAKLSQDHLHILRHSLGLDQHGRTEAGVTCPDETYRNHFVTDEDSDDGPLCLALADAGLMQRHEPRAISGEMPIFTVTPAGRAYVREHSPPPPRVSRGRRRYRAWLQLRNVWPDLTFGEFLRQGGEVDCG